MLVEKYRPQVFDDIIGQDKIVSYYKNMLYNGGEVGHAIYVGDTGVGKTSMAHVVANEFRLELMEYNASDDRSLNFIREKIIPAMKHHTLNGRYKLIFLDESESMLREALFSLRTPMEKYYQNARIIFSCNNMDNLDSVPAIRSRCLVFNFNRISKDDIIKRLNEIAELEAIDVKREYLEYISNQAGGDMRKAINLLEKYVYGGEEEIEYTYLF